MKMASKRPIDWEMARGCKVTDMRVGKNFGSDHKLILFTVYLLAALVVFTVPP